MSDIDRKIGELYQAARDVLPDAPEVAILAVGGYGRDEMSPYSDVDLLFLHQEKSPKPVQELIEKILYPLWDESFELGYAVRNLKECFELMQRDQTIFTGLLESRHIAGFEDYTQALNTKVQELCADEKFRTTFLEDKIDERRQRLKKFGGSVYILEPSVKEAEGSLRDLHLIRWIQTVFQIPGGFSGLAQHGYLSSEEADFLEDCLAFFLQVRELIHKIEKKKKDQLTFVIQVQIAETLGYKDTESSRAVEKFMQDYYSKASQVSHLCKILLKKIPQKKKSLLESLLKTFKSKDLGTDFQAVDDQIFFKDQLAISQKPETLMQVFRLIQKHDLSLNYETLEAVTQHLFLVDDDFRNNTTTSETFKEIMSDLARLGKTFFAMFETHFFEEYIPEFKHLKNRVQHDIYHVYTVDMHSIFALEELSRLYEGAYDDEFPVFKQALMEVKRNDVLSLGLLFHDVGKGKGGSHSEKGAIMAGEIADRLGYSQEDKNDIEFLVLGHLLLSHISQRRDLEDPHLVHELAKTLKTVDRLNMLFVLTWADIRAVSSEAWTEWKGTLLSQLYQKTREVLEGSDMAHDKTQVRLSHLREDLIENLKDDLDRKDLEDFLDNISPRYLFAHEDAEVELHFDLIRKHKKDGFFVYETPLKEAHYSEVLVFTYNNPRVLSLVTGVMMSLDINILGLEVFFMADGFILVKLLLQTQTGEDLSKSRSAGRMQDALRQVFKGELDIEKQIERQKQPTFLAKAPVQRAENRIDIDNDVSPYYTIIDVQTHDRTGLLYEILRTLADQGCYVEVSKISTKVDQVVDTFYVKDIFGHKISGKPKLKEIKDALMGIIQGE